jgi:hypothetical protein
LYNFLVTSQGGQWNETPYEYPRGRSLREHTTANLTEKYGSLDDKAVQELMSFPALFAYETGNEEDARIGWITRIRSRQQTVRIEYQFEPSLPPVSGETLIKLKWDLDITDGEMYRTHWALKDADLLPVLLEAGLIDGEAINSQPQDSKVITLGLEKPVTAIMAKPTVFRIPTTVKQTDLVSIMMPFGTEFSAVHNAIEGGCKTAGLKCERADNVWESSEIIQDIFSLIYRSRIVISDFTGRNPNVFYETGIAHTLGRPVIPIAQHESDVPFDLRHHRFIIYHCNSEGLELLADKIFRRLKTLIRA